ncbi:hypothetical protein M433DRAFT_1874 [Acidomyces richmondensis BFW]|nr:MAG: hypothetical protein FE78DRAFT_136372 [Acidomyces sp. 'richmondensis']KYG48597.1 hypothetical protein M433DRAFT_1874 [Acidomyces richmondensis BFW]
MCITLLTTAHPIYPFILLNNRDEFLSRPTAPAQWWDFPNSHILGGRDLQRSERGTWLGITTDGRISNLTNFRDEDAREISKDKSRGALVNAYLTMEHESDEAFVKYLVDEIGVGNVGGFTLLFGRLRNPKSGSRPGLGIVSNRTRSVEEVKRIADRSGQTLGVSNSHYGDLSWPKVVQGELLLKETVQANMTRRDDREHFINSLFDILSVDTLPRPQPGDDFQVYTRQMRKSILIPPVGAESGRSKPADKVAIENRTDTSDHNCAKAGEGLYGTQQQTVILVDREGKVVYVERTLHDAKGEQMQKDMNERRYEFQIRGWDD